MFGPSVACATYICPLLTSGDSSPHLAMTVALRQTTRSPRVLRTHLHAYLCRIYAAAFRASTGLCIYLPAHPAASPLSAGCSSEQRFACSFLRIPPRDGHPCCSANTSPCRVCRGLTPPSECALPGAPKKEGSLGSPRFSPRTALHPWRVYVTVGALELHAHREFKLPRRIARCSGVDRS